MSTLRAAGGLALASQVSGIALHKFEGSTDCSAATLVAHDDATLGFPDTAGGFTAASTCLTVEVATGTNNYYKITYPATATDPIEVAGWTTADCSTTAATSAELTTLKTVLRGLLFSGATNLPAKDTCYANGSDSYKLVSTGEAGVPSTYTTIRTYMANTDCTANEVNYQGTAHGVDNLDKAFGLASDAGVSIVSNSGATAFTANSNCFQYKSTAATAVTDTWYTVTKNSGAAVSVAGFSDNACSTASSTMTTTVSDAIRAALGITSGGALPTSGVCVTSGANSFKLTTDDAAGAMATTGYATAAPTTTSGSVAATVSAVAFTAGLWML